MVTAKKGKVTLLLIRLLPLGRKPCNLIFLWTIHLHSPNLISIAARWCLQRPFKSDYVIIVLQSSPRAGS